MSQFAVTGLQCEYFDNPLGLDRPQPRLSWRLSDDRRGARQTAYRIQAGSTPGADDLWDTGKTETDRCTHVPYDGAALTSRQRVYWRAKVWDHTGEEGDWSEPAWFEMGLLERNDWAGDWIGAAIGGDPQTSVPAPMLRRAFAIDQPIAQARLYITALGLYEATINGRRVGDAEFTPGWTDYDSRVQYQTYDVTEHLRAGENAIGVWLGDGWAAGHVAWAGRQNYVDRPRLLAQLEITTQDGSVTTIASDEHWRWAIGPIVESDIYMGESYDARQEQSGWDSPGFNDARWQPVEIGPAYDGAIVASASPPVRAVMELKPGGPPTKHGGGNRWVHIYDLGQNMVGRVRITVRGPRGRLVRLRFAEMLQDDGTLYTANLRGSRCTDHYTLRGEDEEVFEPRFTFHGFRYVSVETWRATDVEIVALTGIVLHSDTPATGEFQCSDPMINQLQHNIQWGQRGNFLEVPTDCPQRDERLGWLGDAQVFIPTACFNMDVAGFFAKWHQDLRDAQRSDGRYPSVAPNKGFTNNDGGPAWAEAGVICPWTIYERYGDRRVLAEHYDSMVRFLDFLTNTSRDGLRCWPGCDYYAGYGDWLAIDAPTPGQSPTPKMLIGTAYYARAADLLARAADVLGKTDDTATYRAMFEQIKAAFVREFVTGAGRVTANTQTGYLLALGFDLLPEDLRPAAVEHLVETFEAKHWHLSTGFVGTPLIAPVLTRFGRTDVAYRVLNQQTYPGWLYPILQGATTMWERWNSYTKEHGFGPVSMNSFNHYAYGAIGQWLYATVGGLDTATDPDGAGFKRLRIAPEPGGGLTHASAKLQTMFGPAESSWKIEGGRMTLNVTVPPNTTAEAILPRAKVEAVRDDGIGDAQQIDRAVRCTLAAGRYSLSWDWT